MLRKGPKIHYENIKKTNSTTQNVAKISFTGSNVETLPLPYLDLKEVNQQKNTPMESGAETTKRDCLPFRNSKAKVE